MTHDCLSSVALALETQRLNLTKKFVQKITKELIKIRKYNITTRYKQRIARLLNFAVLILKLPTQIVNLAFHHHQKLYKYVNFIHNYQMSYCTFVNTLPVYTDATPNQIGILAPYENRLDLFNSNNKILENEYLGIFIAHILRPYSPILTDNMAAMFLFRKGRLPPSWRTNYKISKILIETFRKPLVYYINTKRNPADILSRAFINYV